MVDLVISYYKEDLSWLENYKHYNFARIFIYNKGPLNLTDSNLTVPYIEVRLPNIGRCDHTFLYHIIEHYDDLGNYTIFTTGSLGVPNKRARFNFIVNATIITQNSVFLGNIENNNIRDAQYDFKLVSYESTDISNKSGDVPMEYAKIRPFGKWYDHHFNNIKINTVNYHGIFSVSKTHIHNRTKDSYKKLISEFPDNSNPEVGHYFERSWLAVFHHIPQE
jgi:hypothetical protein